MLGTIKNELKKYVRMNRINPGQAKKILNVLHAEMKSHRKRYHGFFKAERKRYKEIFKKELKRELKNAEPLLVKAVRKGKKVAGRYAPVAKAKKKAVKKKAVKKKKLKRKKR